MYFQMQQSCFARGVGCGCRRLTDCELCLCWCALLLCPVQNEVRVEREKGKRKKAILLRQEQELANKESQLATAQRELNTLGHAKVGHAQESRTLQLRPCISPACSWRVVWCQAPVTWSGPAAVWGGFAESHLILGSLLQLATCEQTASDAACVTTCCCPCCAAAGEPVPGRVYPEG
jgi:hypothetical protein